MKRADNAEYTHHRLVALLLVGLWVVGIPLALLGMLVQQWQRYEQARSLYTKGILAMVHLHTRTRLVCRSKQRWEATDANATTLRETVAAGEGDLSEMALLATPDDSLAVYNYTRVRRSFGFCVDDFRPECFWFEPVDMLRKLALSGLLQFVQPGTGAQVFFGCCISFVSFGVQLRFRPFREPEANALKALVDAQIFLTFLISFILRVLLDATISSAEPLQADVYGWLLLGSMVMVLISGVCLTASQIRRRRKFRGGLLGDGVMSAGGFAMDEVTGGGIQGWIAQADAGGFAVANMSDDGGGGTVDNEVDND